ncbi:MAG: hypothetical protein IJ057_08415 [Bacteroidales bacterium]|nr:hypothetical protein [Bacteroidales bacterium]
MIINNKSDSKRLHNWESTYAVKHLRTVIEEAKPLAPRKGWLIILFSSFLSAGVHTACLIVAAVLSGLGLPLVGLLTLEGGD